MSTKCTIVKSFLSTQHYFGVCKNVKEMMRCKCRTEPSANVLRKNEPKNLQILCGSAACQEVQAVLGTGSTRTRTRYTESSTFLPPYE